MSNADTTTQSSDTKPQQLDTSGEVQPKVGDVTKGLHLDASVDNSDQPKVVHEWVDADGWGNMVDDAGGYHQRSPGEVVYNMVDEVHSDVVDELARLAGELEEQVEESRMWMKRCDRRAERVKELEEGRNTT